MPRRITIAIVAAATLLIVTFLVRDLQPEPPVALADDLTVVPAPAHSTTASAGPAPPDCNRAGTLLYDPSSVHFQQVLTYVGPVDPSLIHQAMRDLLPLSKLGVVFFALDGTLLNLARWGRIINDNDVDLGFYVRANVSRFQTRDEIMSHYKSLYVKLGEIGVVSAPDERALQRIHHRHKVVKPLTCKHRGQYMQCRHRNGVIYDLFGPESLFSALSGLKHMGDIEPIKMCRADTFDFPCPARHMHVLQSFTVDVSDPSAKVAAPKAHYEFTGCAAFPRARKEQSKAHLQSIRESMVLLEGCGYPTLSSDLAAPKCKEIMRSAGLH